jgi:hypothetical protein
MNIMLRKIFLSLIVAALIFSGIVAAQSPVLEIHRWENSPIKVELSQLGKITFSGTNMNLNLKSGEVTAVPATSVRNLVFGTITGLSTAGREGMQMKLSPNPATDYIRLTNINPDVKVVSLYSLSGQMLQQLRVNDQELVISIEQLHQGIYFVRAGNEVIKFSKR